MAASGSGQTKTLDSAQSAQTQVASGYRNGARCELASAGLKALLLHGFKDALLSPTVAAWLQRMDTGSVRATFRCPDCVKA